MDETAQPFTYTGAVYVTFATRDDYVDSLQLRRNSVEPITKLNVKIFRITERNDGPAKRSVDESEAVTDEDEVTTTVESTTAFETEENSDTTTTPSVTTSATNISTSTAATTSTTSIPTTPSTHATSSVPKETANGYSSAQEVFSNYFLKYEDRNSEVLIRDVIPDVYNDTITVRTHLSLRKGTLYVVKIEFEGNMTDIGYGFLLSTYVDETQTRRYGFAVPEIALHFKWFIYIFDSQIFCIYQYQLEIVASNFSDHSLRSKPSSPFRNSNPASPTYDISDQLQINRSIQLSYQWQ